MRVCDLGWGEAACRGRLYESWRDRRDLSVCLSVVARADDEEVVRRLSGCHFDDESWIYIPAHDPGTGLVDAIVAIAKPDATIGDNLNAVLFMRSGNEFEAWSWRNATRGRAVYSAKMILNVSDEDDANWLLEEELPWQDDNALRPPVPYMAGMLTDDPLFEPVMGSESPETLIEVLAEFGYFVAANRPENGGGHTTEPCPDQSPMLIRMAAGTEWGITQVIDDEASAVLVAQSVAQFLSGCAGPPCIPGATGPTTSVPPVFKGCEWLFESRTVGTSGVTCTYRLRSKWFESQSTPWMSTSCTPYLCSQSHYGYGFGAEVSCLQPPGSPCSAIPSCANAANYNATCQTPAKQWNPWSPQCP